MSLPTLILGIISRPSYNTSIIKRNIDCETKTATVAFSVLYFREGG